MVQKPLTDNQAHDALYAAREALGEAPGATVHGNTALEAARKALTMLAFGVLVAASVQKKRPAKPKRATNVCKFRIVHVLRVYSYCLKLFSADPH